jgi:formate dehydrogenase subunit gamma
MILAYVKEMLLDKDDIVWLMKIVHYATNHEERLPETRKYNAGQKMYFWVVVFLGSFVFLVSGLAMWFPEEFVAWTALWLPAIATRELVLQAIVVHELMFIAAGAFFVVHLYMGTLGMPGTLSALATGKVTAAWAKAHHPKWYREMTGKA